MSRSATPRRPGLPEIFVGLSCIATFGIGVVIGLVKLGINAVALGIILTALSGVAGMIGFFAAYLLRIRSGAAFGVRGTSWRWIVIGAAVGVVAFFVKSVSIIAYVSLTGDSRTIQDVYATGGSWVPCLCSPLPFSSASSRLSERNSCFLESSPPRFSGMARLSGLSVTQCSLQSSTV